MTLVVKKMKRTEQGMEWWKLGKGRVVFKEEMIQVWVVERCFQMSGGWQLM